MHRLSFLSKGWILFLIVTVGLGLAGGGYAAWTASLRLQGEVRTGSVDAVWDQQRDRESVEVLDPQTGELVARPVPPEKDIADCVSDLQPGQAVRTVGFTVTNAYPSYTCEIEMGGRIVGSVPVHISRIAAVARDAAGNNVLHTELNVDVRVTRKVEGECDLSTDLRVSSQLHEGDQFCVIVRLHAKEAAKQGHTYTAGVELEFIQWNLAGRQPAERPVVTLTESNTATLAGRTQFANVSLLSVQGGGETFTQVFSPGVESLVGEPGLPAVPVYRRLIALPIGTDAVEVDAKPSVGQVLSVNLFPFQTIAVDQSPEEPPTTEPPPPSTFADHLFVKDEDAYSQDALFPPFVVRVTPVDQMRDLTIGLLEIATGQYNPAKGELTLFDEVDWSVEFIGGQNAFLTTRALNPFENITSQYSAVLNSAVIFENPIFIDPGLFPCFGEELMVLTHPDFRAAADELADWKRDKGIPTNVFEVGAGTTRDTANEIKDLIEEHYDDCITRPSYVLFLGDVEFIPTWYEATGGSATTGTDTPYAYVAGGFLNIFPDLAHGRIPVDTLTQAQTVVDKIINYEQNPPFNANFYANASIASQFQCCMSGSPSGRDQRAFIEESEQARNTLMAAGKTVERIYTRTGTGSPARYHDGDPLPADLGSGSGFPWNGSTQDIIDAFNDGRFLIIHRDHGWEDGWVNPEFTKTNVSNDLANGNLTPVVYSLNCASCFYDNESASGDYGTVVNASYFCERLLREADGGAVGIIGDSRNSNTWSNTAFYRGLIDATWPNNDPAYGGNTSIVRLGDIMNYAKEYTLTHIGLEFGGGDEVTADNAVDTLWLYNVIGDPTLEMWTSNPHRFFLPVDVIVTLFQGSLRASYPVNGATLTAYQLMEQGAVPIGRSLVRNGVADIQFLVQPDPESPIQLAASFPGAVSVNLTQPPQQGVPDLKVALFGPANAMPGDTIGDQIDLDVEVRNVGDGLARGTLDAAGNPQGGGYVIDLVLSTDTVVPEGFATPSATFQEDALLVGGRISRTPDVPALSFLLLSPDPPIASDIGGIIPSDTPAGDYFLCARIDPGNAVAEQDEGNNVFCLGISIGGQQIQLPSFKVVQQGVTPEQFAALADRFDLPPDALQEDGSVRFTDLASFQQVPTVPLDGGFSEEDRQEIMLEAFDFEAIKAIQVPSDETALAMARSALKDSGLDPRAPYQSADMIGHSMFEAVQGNGEVMADVALDTQVNHAFQLGGLAVVGPGAEIKLAFGPGDKLTHLTYALRGVEQGDMVPIISQSQADRLALDMLTKQGVINPEDLQLSSELVYYAPPSALMSVQALYPHYQYSGMLRLPDGQTVQLRRMLIPAVRDPELVPSVDMDVTVEGTLVSATSLVSGGTPPYTYQWASSTTQLDPAVADEPSIEYDVTLKGKSAMETLTLVVTDANGISAQAVESFQVSGGPVGRLQGDSSASSGGVLASPMVVGGVNDVGTEWVGQSQGLGGSAGNAGGFVNRFILDNIFFGGSTTIRFNWGDFNAWEQDFKDPANGGDDGNWVDNVDAVFYTGHANSDGFTFPGNNQDGFLHYTEARWGNNVDLEWLIVAACGPLQPGTSPNRWWQRWGPAFRGLHLLGGYETITYDNTVEGWTWANYMLSGWTVRQAWMQTGIDVQGPSEIVAVMGVFGTGGLSNWNDHYWGEGSVGPDITNIVGYWKVSSPG